jgi:indolepyruvate ferredoxin oxidoreductase alpha subunit
LEKHLQHSEKILIVEEVIPFLEENVKILAAELAPRIGVRTFFGKRDKSLPSAGELNPDLVTAALSKILNIPYIGMEEAYEKQAKLSVFFNAPPRDWTFCAGCPHRASYWSIRRVLQLDNREGFVCGDIGCYTLGMLPSGYSVLKTVHSMGSGIGVASGFGKLRQFGMDQPVLAVCGDSTFFHAAMPALVNAVHHRSDITLIILDNSGTGMTGFQPHPGLCRDALSADAPAVDIADVCRAMGADVKLCDPFDAQNSQKTLLETIQNRRGVHVLIFRQICALSPEKKNRKLFDMSVREEKCIGKSCGCNRLCTRIFGCPGMIWDREKKKARIDTVICSGCGFCASICPVGAIEKKEVA